MLKESFKEQEIVKRHPTLHARRNFLQYWKVLVKKNFYISFQFVLNMSRNYRKPKQKKWQEMKESMNVHIKKRDFPKISIC